MGQVEFAGQKGPQEAGKPQGDIPKPIQKVQFEVKLRADYQRSKLVEVKIEHSISDPEFQRALASHLEGVQKIVVEQRPEGKRGRELPLTEFLDGGRTLRYNVQNAESAYKDFVAGTRSLLAHRRLNAEVIRVNEDMQVDGNMTLKSSIDRQLSKKGGLDAIKKRVLDTATWSDFNPDELSGGRSIVLRLAKPVKINGRVYQGVKLKGCTYGGFMEPIPETYTPHVPPKLESLRGLTTRCDYVGDDNRVKSEVVKKPKGGCMKTECENEFVMGIESYKTGDNVDIPLMTGFYRDLVYGGENLGFIATLVPEVRQERMEKKINKKLRQTLEKASTPKRYDEQGGQVGLRFALEGEFYKMGRALRRLHDHGFYHGFPHYGNVTEVDGEYYFTDFASARRMPKDELKQITCRILDLNVMFNHFSQMAIFERESQEFMMQVGAHPIGALFEGYFHDRNSDMLPIKMAEHQIRCDSPQCPHNLMNMIEFGREAPLDQMRIPAGPYAGQKVEYNGEPGNEFVYMMKDLMHPERLARVQKEKRRIGMFVLPVTPITIRHRDQQGKEIFRETVGRNVTQEQLIAEVCEDGHVVHEAIKKLEEKGWWQVNVQMAREGPYHRIYKRQRALVIGLDPKTNIERAKKQMLETIDMVMNYPIQEQS